MKLGYPDLRTVQACDPNRSCVSLLRWKTFLPLPTTPEQERVADLIVQKLNEVSPEHLETIEKAVGYAA